MNAAVVKKFGEPPVYGSFPEASLENGEIPVQVRAAGLHPIVKALANGTHYGSTGVLPFIPGLDGTGILADGRRVYFAGLRPPYGTMAEIAPANERMCIALPNGLDDITAAAIANPGMSSWAALKERAKFVSGENLMVLGATGVAGKLAVQIGRRLGAKRIIAAGRNRQTLESTLSLGADEIIFLDQPEKELVNSFGRALAGEGIGVVLDYLWGHPAECFLQAVSQKGLTKISARIRFVQVGESAGSIIALRAATLRSSGLEMLGSGFGSVPVNRIMEILQEFLRSATDAHFQIDVKTAPLREVEYLWNSDSGGARLVLTP